MAYWLKNRQTAFIWLSGAAILIFRSELCIICGLMLLISLIKRHVSISSLILNGALATICFVGLSVLVDSNFWGKTLWPEGSVLWFNTVLNKSSEWGTSPFLWYFYSALPRALLFSLFLLPFALLNDRNKVLINLLVPAIGFVFLYSFLPHKELRFIIYIVPLLNSVASKGLNDV
jgi:alpha-1,6-mannosyltransferase